MKTIASALYFMTILALTPSAFAQDKTVKCTFDGKVVESTCPKDKAPLCDAKEKKIKCTDSPYSDKKDKK